MNVLRSRSFVPTIVYTDPGAGFHSLGVYQFPGVIIDTGGAKDNNAKVDIKIRRLKELCRSVQASLPWAVPKTMVKDLLAYAVARLNIRRMTEINQNVCPKVLFTGIKMDFSKELTLEFGTYAEVYDGTDNTSRSQSITCVALYPCSNSTGSWEFMNLKTKTRMRRSHWIKMKPSELIVEVMIKFDDKAELPVALEQVLEPEKVSPAPDAGVSDIVVKTPVEVSTERSEIEQEQSAMPVEEPLVASRTLQQVGKSILWLSKYTMATKSDKRSETNPAKVAVIKAAEVKEIKQIFEGLQAVEAVYENEVEGKAHGCHMFTVDKFLADGTFDKCKGRVVLHGNEQDPEMYPDRLSPTVAVHFLLA